MKKNLISLFVCTLVSVSAWAGTDGKNVHAVKLTGQEVKIAKENRRKYMLFLLNDNIISKQSYGEQGVFAHKFSQTEWNKADEELAIGKNDGTLLPVYVCGQTIHSFAWIPNLEQGICRNLLLLPTQKA